MASFSRFISFVSLQTIFGRHRNNPFFLFFRRMSVFIGVYTCLKWWPMAAVKWQRCCWRPNTLSSYFAIWSVPRQVTLSRVHQPNHDFFPFETGKPHYIIRMVSPRVFIFRLSSLQSSFPPHSSPFMIMMMMAMPNTGLGR